MARLVCMAGLSLLALCRGAAVERQRSVQSGRDNIDPEDRVGLLPQKVADAEDHVALLQHVLEPRRRQTEPSALSISRLHSKRGLQTGQIPSGPDGPEFDCARHPEFCRPPFNCHLNNATSQALKYRTLGIASDGRPDLQSWCGSPKYAPYMSKCAAGELLGAAHVQFQLTEAGKYGPFTKELDGSYCFIEGHCANTAVTENTTLEEASQLCDERFGREAWARWGADDTPAEDRMGGIAELVESPLDGFTSRGQLRPFVLAACAMGNFHCDVVYCRETYCKKDYYVDKYGHFLKELGWVE